MIDTSYNTMPNYNFKISNHKREDVIQYVKEMKAKGTFKVVDVGGTITGWSADIIDALIDFNEPQYNLGSIKHFKCDITDYSSWEDIRNYVLTNGKYDFCICTHTLEDIINPKFVCEQLSTIASAGYIAVPTKHRELSRFEMDGCNYRGHIHHRWIFNIEDNVFVGYPKINYLDSTNVFDAIACMDDNKSDLSFYWKDNIDIRYLNNNYLGPNLDAAIGYYNKLLL
jgi:hypothetical protein